MSSAADVGAFFDLDGTLLAAPSLERRFIFYLVTRGVIGPTQFANCAARFVTNIARNSRTAIEANKAYYSGVSASYAEKWSAQFALYPLQLLSAGLRCLESHFKQGHTIFLITGVPAPLAEAIAKYLPVPLTIIGTQLDARNGLWTGEISGEHMCGAAKRRAIIQLAGACGLNLARSFAYGDSASDLPMLETVAYPTAVNPSKRLARIARLRAWPVLRRHATETNPLKTAGTAKAFLFSSFCAGKYSSQSKMPAEQTYEHDLF